MATEIAPPGIIPENEQERLSALRRYGILNTPPEETFQHIARLMADLFEVPIALVSLVDQHQVLFKGNVGMPGVHQADRTESLCSFAILSSEPTIFDKPLEEPCLLANPLVHGSFGVRFYAGAPLITNDGFPIGSVCIVDKKERSFSGKEQEALVRFAALVMNEIELRRGGSLQQEVEAALRAKSEEFEFLTDTMPQLVWASEAVGYSYYFNRRWMEYTGLRLEELKGDGWMRTLHPDDLPETARIWRNAVETTCLYDVEYRVRRFDGAYRWFLVRGAPMKDDTGKVLRWYGTTTDIHDQKMAEAALKKSEERFGLVAKATQDVIWDWDLHTNHLWWNDGFKELFGYSAEEIGSDVDSWYSRVHPDDKERVIGGIHQTIDLGETHWSSEYRFRKKDGSYAIVLDRGYALPDKEGKPYRMLGSMQDITQRKAAEEAIRISEQRFQNLIREASVSIVVLMGEELRVSVVNAAFARLLNEQVDTLMDRSIFDVLPDAENPFRALLDSVRLTGEPVYLYDQPYKVHSDGEKREGYLNIIYQPYRESDGVISGVVALCQDVTDQVMARKKIEEAEETAKIAIDSAELGTFNVDLKTNAIISSERLDQIFDVGHSQERERYVSAIHPDDIPIRVLAYEAAYQTGVLEYEARVVRKDGSITWFRAKGRIFFDGAGQPDKLLGVVQEITKEKQFSEELTKKVKERTQELEQLTYVSHHDLQEPLRKIIMFSDLVRSDGYDLLTPASRQRFDKITDSAKRMSKALRDVLEYASLNKEESMVDVDLDEVYAAVLSDLELIIQEKKARISSDALPVIQALPHQMHQLFYNLVNNALKFAKPGESPVVRITCGEPDPVQLAEDKDLHAGKKYIQIVVQDNGIGFHPEAAQKIFGMFQRLHRKEEYAGTGIGLALVKKVVSNHGGKIRAEGRPGAGATFTVLLLAGGKHS